MFLIGGPAYSGTTLLALLLTQGDLFCLDEPDFHNPAQSHRGIQFLKRIFTDRNLPEDPQRPLNDEETVTLVEQCERALSPVNLGLKTCNSTFIGHAKVYRKRGYPVIAIIRDIRDALVTQLPDWITETGLNDLYRLIWHNLEMYDLLLRYENLVTDMEGSMREISRVLSYPLEARHIWDPKVVYGPMLKGKRHDLLKTGRIAKDRIGIWRNSGKEFSERTEATAKMMGY